MKWKNFIVGYVLALAMFLFAQRHPAPTPRPVFSSVVDLTHTYVPEARSSIEASATGNDRPGELVSAGYFPTLIQAPAKLYPGLWMIDQIPSQRLIARLVVLDVQRAAQSSRNYEVSMEDIISWENSHGKVPMGTIVMARTGWDERRNSMNQDRGMNGKVPTSFPGYSVEAARFLVQGRNAVALGIDSPSIDSGASKNAAVRKYTEWHSVYELDNVGNLGAVPESGANVVVAPAKLQGRSNGPVRILALVK